MRNFLKFLVIAPVALVFLAFALANRHSVVVSFDPFNSGDISSPQIVLPMFIVVIGATMFGVILGGFATWIGQGRFRKAERVARAKVEDLRGEIEFLRNQIADQKPAGLSKTTAITPVRGAA
jgi:uncharacterized integral membrane protein